MDRRELIASAASSALAPAQPARRVVSLNSCLDAILLAVADPAQVTALSHYARDPHSSTVAVEARRFPMTWESAEEVMMLRPDLVLASRHSSPATRAALTRFGVRQELFSVPKTIAESTAQVRKVARLIGRRERGEQVVARIEAAIGASAPAPGARPVTAIVFQPRGFSAGSGTLIDEMMRRAGLENVAARYGIRNWGNVALERLIADPPRLILAAEPSPGAPTFAERVASHPALAGLGGRMVRVVFPERLLYCGGPALTATAEVLGRARREAT